MTDAAPETPPLDVESPPVEPPVEVLPVQKKKGRPPGSADVAPRTRRPNIRIEPVRIDTPRPEKEVAPVVAEPIPPPEPQTPRSALRDAHAHVVNMRNEYKNSRQTAMATAYSSKLCQWVL